jgi:peptide/nickel transport system ATP-binding protein
MSAVPVPDPVIEDRRERILLTGDLPSPANPPKGCRFHTRCPWRQETRCDTERPELRVIDIAGVPANHRVACHFAEQIESGEVSMHEVKAQLTTQEDQGGDTDFMGPASVQEAL